VRKTKHASLHAAAEHLPSGENGLYIPLSLLIAGAVHLSVPYVPYLLFHRAWMEGEGARCRRYSPVGPVLRFVLTCQHRGLSSFLFHDSLGVGSCVRLRRFVPLHIPTRSRVQQRLFVDVNCLCTHFSATCALYTVATSRRWTSACGRDGRTFVVFLWRADPDDSVLRSQRCGEYPDGRHGVDALFSSGGQ